MAAVAVAVAQKNQQKNTQDKFYNLAQDITAEEEKTTKIAERYNQLLENRLVTGEQLRDQSRKELESLEKTERVARANVSW